VRTGWKVFYYVNSSGGRPIEDFINALAGRQQAKIARIFFNVETYGLKSVLPHTKKLAGTSLWEFRILGKDNIRVLYVIPEEGLVLVLHGFIKKTQKTPNTDIKLAEKRYRNWRERKTRRR
jgi:phage-related protein